MRFSVNGSDQGIAFRVSKSELAGRPLFPHVLTKNQVADDDAGDGDDVGDDGDDDDAALPPRAHQEPGSS